MKRTPSGLPEDWVQFDPAKYFKVIHRESSIKDESINDRIQREGCHCDPVGSKNIRQSVWGGSESGNIHEVNWFRNSLKKEALYDGRVP
jgi:hypothetical protein